jgi:hypothetical protein
MTDIVQLLTTAAASADAPPTQETVEADVRRGRAALSQRRRRRVVQGVVVAAPIVAVALVGAGIVIGGQGDGGSAPASGSNVDQIHGPAKGAPVRLVAYEGEQLQGFVVDQVPEGWYLQGSNPFSLTIAPVGDTTSPDGFEGKLVVMLQSSSVAHRLPRGGDQVTVGGNDGVISHGPPADTLTFDDGNGHIVQVQAWTSALGWTDEQLVAFAEGVQVTADAQAGVG